MRHNWLVIGGSGMLGHTLSAYLAERGAKVVASCNGHTLMSEGWSKLQLDLVGPFDVARLIEQTAAEVVVYAAGLTNVDRCEADEALALHLHATAAADFAAACRGRSKYVYISTDHLWDGKSPFVSEDEPLAPQNAYARTKAAGELRTLEANPETLILRTNFFGQGLPWRKSLSDWMLAQLKAQTPFQAFDDAFFTPIVMPLLAQTIVEAVHHDLNGIYHACGAERISKYEFACRLADQFDLSKSVIGKGYLTDAGLKAPRPADMSLATGRIAQALGRPQPDLVQSLEKLVWSSSDGG